MHCCEGLSVHAPRTDEAGACEEAPAIWAGAAVLPTLILSLVGTGRCLDDPSRRARIVLVSLPTAEAGVRPPVCILVVTMCEVHNIL